MEREMCGYLEWNLNVGGEEVLEFEAKIRAQHGARAVARPSSSASSSSDSCHASVIVTPATSIYPTPETTPDVSQSRPIRPVPSPYKNRSSYHHQQASQSQPNLQQHSVTVTAASGLPSPPASPTYLHAHSPQPPHFASAMSSLQSSPASDDCKTPSPVAVTDSSRISGKHSSHAHMVDMARYDARHPAHHRSHLHQSHQPHTHSHHVGPMNIGYPINVSGW